MGKLAWLFKRDEEDLTWEITFDKPESYCYYEVKCIVYFDIEDAH